MREIPNYARNNASLLGQSLCLLEQLRTVYSFRNGMLNVLSFSVAVVFYRNTAVHTTDSSSINKYSSAVRVVVVVRIIVVRRLAQAALGIYTLK